MPFGSSAVSAHRLFLSIAIRVLRLCFGGIVDVTGIAGEQELVVVALCGEDARDVVVGCGPVMHAIENRTGRIKETRSPASNQYRIGYAAYSDQRRAIGRASDWIAHGTRWPESGSRHAGRDPLLAVQCMADGENIGGCSSLIWNAAFLTRSLLRRAVTAVARLCRSP